MRISAAVPTRVLLSSYAHYGLDSPDFPVSLGFRASRQLERLHHFALVLSSNDLPSDIAVGSWGIWLRVLDAVESLFS